MIWLYKMFNAFLGWLLKSLTYQSRNKISKNNTRFCALEIFGISSSRRTKCVCFELVQIIEWNVFENACVRVHSCVSDLVWIVMLSLKSFSSWWTSRCPSAAILSKCSRAKAAVRLRISGVTNAIFLYALPQERVRTLGQINEPPLIEGRVKWRACEWRLVIFLKVDNVWNSVLHGL